MVGGRSARGSRRHAAAASVVVPFPRGAAGARLDLVRFVPSGRSLLVTLGALIAIGLAYWVAYATPVFAVDTIEIDGAPPALQRDVDASHATTSSVTASSRSTPSEVEGTLRALPAVAGVSVDRAFPSTLVVQDRARAAGRRDPSRRRRRGSRRGPARSFARSRSARRRGCPRLWLRRGTTIRVGGQIPAGLVPATRALAEAHARGHREPREGSPHDRRRADPRPPPRHRDPSRPRRGRRHEARRSRARCSPSSTAARRTSTSAFRSDRSRADLQVSG